MSKRAYNAVSFSRALEAMQRGENVRRGDWDDGMFLFITQPSISDKSLPCLPALVLRKPNAFIVGYVPSQEDMYVCNWEILLQDKDKTEQNQKKPTDEDITGVISVLEGWRIKR